MPAKYVPVKEPLLVVVENYRQPSGWQADADLLARYVERELETSGVAPVVDSNKLREMRLSQPAEYKNMSVAALGRAVGAKQVLYLNLTSDDIEELIGGESLRADATIMVKVIDAGTGEARWPTDTQAGYPVQSALQWGSDNRGQREAEVKQKLMADLGVKVGRLFHKWKPETNRAEE